MDARMDDVKDNKTKDKTAGQISNNYIVSACLAGFKCRFDGNSKPCEKIVRLYREGRAKPVCPESMSGLKSPRPPAEWRNGRAIDKTGADKTAFFEKGAEKALEKALASGCRRAIVKSRSPSCGYKLIYDGSFTHTLCEGNGIWTQKLLDNGFEIYTEENLPEEIQNMPPECEGEI